ncbi:MAG TPA: endo-1,4-beta-xylanase [Azospirillum sp.]
MPKPKDHPMPLTRRALLGALSGAAGLAAVPALAEGPRQTLLEVCRARGIRHGAARDHGPGTGDDLLDRLIERECDVVAPENGGKWAVLQPADGHYEWARLDAAVELARRIGAQPVWHTVLWQHESMPGYMRLPAERMPALGITEPAYFAPDGTLTPENHWRRFTGHVAAVRARYGDAFYRVDVANEVFFWETELTHPGQQDRHGFRKGMWWAVAGGARGPEWLDPFFHHARTAFPTAKLVVNEFGIELAEGWQRRKRDAFLRWLTGAVKRGVPIDGVGLQSHLIAGKPYDREGMRAFLRAVDALGLPVHITELDVDERLLPASWSRADKDAHLAATLGEYLRDVVRLSTLVEVTWWGLRSDLNFIALQRPDLGARPTPYDPASRPLPLYEAAVRALSGKPRGV